MATFHAPPGQWYSPTASESITKYKPIPWFVFQVREPGLYASSNPGMRIIEWSIRMTFAPGCVSSSCSFVLLLFARLRFVAQN
ncbi:hypothetical protein ACEPAF_7909 [Sanghuangporus sanghuang]